MANGSGGGGGGGGRGPRDRQPREPAREPARLGRCHAARVTRDQHQPRRQGGQGRPSVLVHRARGDRRRQRPRRPGLRQGQGGAPRHPEGHRGGPQEPVQGSARRLDDRPPRHRRDRCGPGVHEARRSRYRRHRRWRRPRHPRGGRHPRRAVQVAGLVQPHQRGPGHHRRAQGPAAARTRWPSCAASRPRSCSPVRSCRPTATASGPGSSPKGSRRWPTSRSPRSSRRSAPSPSTAARCGRWGCGASARRTRCPTVPRSAG